MFKTINNICSQEQLAAYKIAMDSARIVERQIVLTIDYIKEYADMKVPIINN